jgi:uncharacterized protein YecE (DUF72 family)
MPDHSEKLCKISAPVSVRGCSILVGTCGYSYTEWVDNGFYPAGTKTADMLGLYARSFSVVELNYTWYQMARAEAMARMMAKAPEHLLFAAKLTRTLTHEREGNLQEQLRLYREGIAPLGSRLAAILIQLPPDFTRTTGNRRYLAALLDGLDPLPAAVEFRHASWAVDPVFAELERRRVSLVTVDTPPLPGLFPSLDVVTNPDLFYVRFHGRNLSGWRTTNMQKKFDYDYSPDELHHWAATRLQALASHTERGIIFFNNHVRAQAPNNARQLIKVIIK